MQTTNVGIAKTVATDVRFTPRLPQTKKSFTVNQRKTLKSLPTHRHRASRILRVSLCAATKAAVNINKTDVWSILEVKKTPLHASAM